ncbi:MAG TPA: hypothetical protein VFU49_14330 [Ktedonobacteraceae bacterium]|nr:hypothetical protein [Ktedonobacteraceae bacterium]
MSLEHLGTTKKVRPRNQRNRPRLVTEQTDGLDTEMLAPDTDKLAADLPEVATEAAPAPKRRLPGFFSTIGKNGQDSTAKEVDVAQARLARATRKKGAQPEKATATPAKAVEKKTTRPATSTGKAAQRPASAFKTRYIIGMALYLIGANFIGGLEQTYLRSAGLDRQITSFPLFGTSVVITTSTLLFLATLVIFLIVLARLDLIPRSLTAISGSPTPAASSKTRTKVREEAPKAETEGDKLYQAYRANQRREKKR